jgi:hypothetical protein
MGSIEPPTDLDGIRARFIILVGELVHHLEMSSARVDIRDRIAALALVDRVLAREKPDDDAARGSAVAKYEGAFKKADGTRRGTEDTGTAGEPAPGKRWLQPGDTDDAGIPVA